MVEKYNGGIIPMAKVATAFDEELKAQAKLSRENFEAEMDKMQFHEALENVWKLIRRTNKYIDETMPWALAKDEAKKDELDTVLYNLCESIRIVATLIRPMMETTANNIYDQLGIAGQDELTNWESANTFGLIGENTKVHKGESLFPRLDIEKEVNELEELFSANVETVDLGSQPTLSPHCHARPVATGPNSPLFCVSRPFFPSKLSSHLRTPSPGPLSHSPHAAAHVCPFGRRTSWRLPWDALCQAVSPPTTAGIIGRCPRPADLFSKRNRYFFKNHKILLGE